MTRHENTVCWMLCIPYLTTRIKINGNRFSESTMLLLLNDFSLVHWNLQFPVTFMLIGRFVIAKKKEQSLKWLNKLLHSIIIIHYQRWHSLGIRNAFYVCSLIVVWTSKANRERKSDFNLFSFCLIFSCFNVQWA